MNDSVNMTVKMIQHLPITRNQTLKHFIHVSWENDDMMMMYDDDVYDCSDDYKA